MNKHNKIVHAHYTFVGHIIGRAIKDYKNISPDGASRSYHESAKTFLFHNNNLENFCNRFQCHGIINIGMIRKHARGEEVMEYRDNFLNGLHEQEAV